MIDVIRAIARNKSFHGELGATLSFVSFLEKTFLSIFSLKDNG